MRTSTALLAFLVLAAPAAAQSEWLAAEGTSIALEYRHPSMGSLPDEIEPSPLNGTFFLSGRLSLPATGIALLAELPYGYFAFEDQEGGGGLIGNLYLGVEVPVLLGAAVIEGGMRMPTAGDMDPDDAAILAFTATFPDRYDAFGGTYFLQPVFAPRVGVRAGVPGIPVFDVEANVSTAYMMRRGDDFDIDELGDDLMIDGGVRGFANVLGLRAGAGIEGAVELTGEDDEDFGERSMFQAGLWADYSLGMLRPGVSFFIPLNENSSFVLPQSESESSQPDWLLGLSLEVDLPL